MNHKRRPELPFGNQDPARRTMSFMLIYAGCSSFFSPFFSTTGPCVSAVGGGGASPIRFE
jgi:hypothetical protein